MHQRRKAFCHLVFLISEGLRYIEIHRRMEVQYSDACLSLQQVYKWTRKFKNGISSVTDCPRPGQAHTVVKPEGIDAVEAILKENRHVTVNEIATHLDVSHGSAHRIVRDKKYLKYSNSYMKQPHVSAIEDIHHYVVYKKKLEIFTQL